MCYFKMATIYSDEKKNIAFDILPTILVQKNRKRDVTSAENSYEHVIRKRDSGDSIIIDDIKTIRSDLKFRRQKRALNGKQTILNVELLVVTDSTVYANFQRLTGSSNKATVFAVMKHYYAHLINGVTLKKI